LLIGLFMACLSKAIYAQNQTPSAHQPVSFRASYQLLHSTHRTNFNGVSVDANHQFTKRFSAGIGVQYAATPKHPDNGWQLTHLHLLPVYANGIYTFNTNHIVQPYLHTEAGISFNHYYKRNAAASLSPFAVSETGLYLSENVGVRFALWQQTHLFVEAGYKGYKHSFNALDVNPHGFTVRAGIEL
ncbi:MAG: porin family protein, partial [Bacteroidota bacterium]|nr:porin family protein [Bacteroidota bacterium]